MPGVSCKVILTTGADASSRYIVMTSPVLYLASASPRRRDLLSQMGLAFRCLPVSLDEKAEPGESPGAYVRRIALNKLRAALSTLQSGSSHVVLAADTAVVAGGELLGKPTDEADALAMLGRLSGATHEVMSAVAAGDGAIEMVAVSCSKVKFRVLERAECRAYWATGEPADKAGAYAIQGLGAAFVEHLEGSYSGVMGLPVFETLQLLEQFGIHALTGRQLAEPNIK